MSQVNSSYARKDHELYPTPAWCTRVLLPHVDLMGGVWEPAAGEGQMADELPGVVCRSDVRDCSGLDAVVDFLECRVSNYPNIVTNPPYGKGGKLAEAFIEHALRLTEPHGGTVAMLLRIDFDSAKTRRYLFADNPAWSKKLVLLNRIKWFDGPAGPSENHAWFCWSHKHEGPATIAYAVRDA